MTRGALGWQLAEGLERMTGDRIISKTYRDSFADTELQRILNASQTTRLVVVGAHSDYCVQTTALSALGHGYDVTLVSDAHTAQPAELGNETVPAMAIVALINARMATLRYPGRTVEVIRAAGVSF
jgi:nicotinamidase-related amidase